MADVKELLQGVDFERDFDPSGITWHDTFGFMHDPAHAPHGRVHVVGFAVPYRPGGETPVFNDDQEVQPVTRFADLPGSLQNVKHVSKGVGTRFYTDKETAQSGSDVDLAEGLIGLYSLEIYAVQIRDWRNKQGGPARQIARHLLQRGAGIALGPNFVASRAHARYGLAGAVLLNVPVQGKRDMKHDNLRAPDGVEPAFMVLRQPNLRLTRIGRVGLAAPTHAS